MTHEIDVNKIRENADIVRVVSSYIPLQQKGRNYVAVCPFHNDSNPSLTVSQEKQIYKCFSCGASGNVFTFVQEYEKIKFLEAVKKVCELTNQRVEGFEKVIKKVEFGVYLADTEPGQSVYEEIEERILLPIKQVPEKAVIGDAIEVFVYRDSKDRLIATTNFPTCATLSIATL